MNALAQNVTGAHVTTYDARTCIGSYALGGDGRFRVYGSNGCFLGTANSRRDAQDLLYRAYVGEARS